MRKAIVALGLTALASTAVVTSAPHVAQAQTVPAGRVNAFPQGMIGTGLLGAEAVIIIESVAGLHNRWVILGTGLVGLIGGGVGGYFIDHAIDTAQGPSEVSSTLLIVGAGLIIPAAIAYVSATMYRPEDHTNQPDDNANAVPLDESTGRNSSTAPAGQQSEPGSAAAPPGGGGGEVGGGHALHNLLGPEALLNLRPGRMRLGVPSLSIASAYSLDEMRQYGLAPTNEYRVPLFSAAF